VDCPQCSSFRHSRNLRRFFLSGIALAADDNSSDLTVAAALPASPYAKTSCEAVAALPSYPVSQLVPSRSGQVIRILLSRASKTPDLAMIDGASIINLASMQPAYNVAAGSRFQLRCENKRLVFSGADQFCLAQAQNSSAIRQVVAMAPRVLPPLSGFQPNGAVLNKFSLAFDVPAPALKPPSGSDLASPTVSSAPPAPRGGIKPIGYLVVPQVKDGLLSYNGRVYRGAIWLKPVAIAAGEVSFQAINIIDLEDYLLSVVPSEMPTTWHLEAIKAQSIAARSYAVANYWKNEKENYDLKDTTDDQVYLGVESETASGNRACDETAGVVLKHNQKVISAFFHSTSGGATEAGENVWGKEIPYVQSVVDYDDNSPHFSWQRRFTIDQAEKAFGLKTGALLSIHPFWKVPSNRVKQAAIISVDNTSLVSGERLRQLFKLPSSIFNVSFEDGSYIFAGRGFGHGLGMSQYGARTLAESGYNAAQILSYYYRDVSVEYLNRSPGI
jgi:stage II sporulation protein D